MTSETDLLFGDLYLNEKQSDVTIVVHNVKLSAHRNVLSQRCHYFEMMFSSGLLESVSNVIKVQEVSIDDFKCVLKWIYTGTTDITSIDNAFEVLRLADMYNIPDLVNKAAEYFMANLTVDIVCPILNEAVLLSLDKLTDAVISFVEDNPNEVLKHETFKILSTDALKVMLNRGIFAADKDDVFNAVKAWMDANPTKFVGFSDVLKNMPLGTLPQKNLAAIPVHIFNTLAAPSIAANRILKHPKTDPLRQLGVLNLGYQLLRNVLLNILFILFGLEGFLYLTNTSKDKAEWDHVLKHGPIHRLKNKNLTTKRYGCSSVISALGTMFCKNGVEKSALTHPIGDSHGMVFDLGRRFMVNYLEMWPTDYKTNCSYWISVSEDKITWDCVIDRSKYSCRRLQRLYFEARPVRYIRICGTASADGEMKVTCLKAFYTTQPFKIDPETTLRIPSHNFFYDSEFIQGKILEGDIIREVGDTPNEGFIYQLNQPYLLDSMKVNANQDSSVYSYNIEVSTDRVTWTRVFGEENVSGLRNVSFDRLVVLFIKCTCSIIHHTGEKRLTFFFTGC